MIISIVIGLLTWFVLCRRGTRFRNKASRLYLMIIPPIVMISLMSTFLIIGNYQIEIFICNYYIPLSFPFEITHCRDMMPMVPANFLFYFKIFGFRILLFNLVVKSTWEIIETLLLLGFFLFALNYVSTCVVIVAIERGIKHHIFDRGSNSQ